MGGFDPSTLAPFFQTLWTDLGLYSPGAGAGAADPTTLTDLTTLLGGLDSTLSTDLTTLLGGLEPSALSADLSTELTNLLGNSGATLGPDLANILLSSF